MRVGIDVRLEDDTVWLTQAHIAELFGKSKPTINEHIKNIFADGELDGKVVIRKFLITTRHGVIEGLRSSNHLRTIKARSSMRIKAREMFLR